VTVAHIMGFPIEESVVQLAPVGVGIISAFVVAGRARLARLRRRLRDLTCLRRD
jgi:hypothetical protein